MQKGKINVELWNRKYIYIAGSKQDEFNREIYAMIIQWFCDNHYEWINGHDAIRVTVESDSVKKLQSILNYEVEAQ